MTLRFYDSATASVRDFTPVHPGEARIYYCGATVQGAPHIGHVRSGLVFDQLSRWLTYRGYKVTMVRNVTDIDDKILANSAASFEPDYAGEHPAEEWWALAYRFERVFGQAYASLNIAPPTYEPRATGHIPEMLNLIERLTRRGHAYAAEDGSGDIYFDIKSWPKYGALTRQDVNKLQDVFNAGFRGKRHPHDFALWKGYKEGEPFWSVDKKQIKEFLSEDFKKSLNLKLRSGDEKENLIAYILEKQARYVIRAASESMESFSGHNDPKKFTEDLEERLGAYLKKLKESFSSLERFLLLESRGIQEEISALRRRGSGNRVVISDVHSRKVYGLRSRDSGYIEFEREFRKNLRLKGYPIRRLPLSLVTPMLEFFYLYPDAISTPEGEMDITYKESGLKKFEYVAKSYIKNLGSLYVGGRPGWHLECSAMAGKYLGETFDIHGGGLDLRFPHHENEMAQSQAAGYGFANFWMHNGLVNYEGEKMSKSIGNIITPAQMLEAARPLVVRYYLGQAHYRSVLDYHPTSLEEARVAVERVEAFLAATRDYHREDAAVPDAFAEAMDDDLNIPKALAALHAGVRAGNAALAAGESAQDAAEQVYAMAKVLGLVELMSFSQAGAAANEPGEHAALDSLIQTMLTQRAEAREAKDWARADQIRDALAAAGITVKDGASGSTWSL